MTKPKKTRKLRCLNFVPLKSLEKEGLEAKLIVTKKIKQITISLSSYYSSPNHDAFAKDAARGTRANAYRSYWRVYGRYPSHSIDVVCDYSPYIMEYGTFTVKLYELNKLTKK